jgi:hypothetical protein
MLTRVEKVSDHRTIGPRNFFHFPENISPRKKKIVERNGKIVRGKFTP